MDRLRLPRGAATSAVVPPLVGFFGAAMLYLLGDALVFGAVLRLAAFPREKIETAPSQMSLFALLAAFGVATIGLLLLLRWFRSRQIFSALFAVGIFGGTWTYLDIFLPEIPALLFGAALTGLLFFLPRVAVVDSVLLLAISGVAIALGISATIPTLLLFLALLSLYDVIAVYGTKHMVTMARGLLSRGVPFAFVVPPRWSALNASVARMGLGHGFFLFGTGDIVLPTAVLAAAALVSFSLAASVAIGTLAGLGLLTLLFLLQKEPHPMPALPPLAAGTLLGYLVGTFLL